MKVRFRQSDEQVVEDREQAQRLLSCPFPGCGSKKAIPRRNWTMTDGCWWRIICLDCGRSGPVARRIAWACIFWNEPTWRRGKARADILSSTALGRACDDARRELVNELNRRHGKALQDKIEHDLKIAQEARKSALMKHPSSIKKCLDGNPAATSKLWQYILEVEK